MINSFLVDKKFDGDIKEVDGGNIVNGEESFICILENKAYSSHFPYIWETFLLQVAVK